MLFHSCSSEQFGGSTWSTYRPTVKPPISNNEHSVLGIHYRAGDCQWVITGKAKGREPANLACVREVFEETGLSIDPTNFEFVCRTGSWNTYRVVIDDLTKTDHRQGFWTGPDNPKVRVQVLIELTPLAVQQLTLLQAQRLLSRRNSNEQETIEIDGLVVIDPISYESI